MVGHSQLSCFSGKDDDDGDCGHLRWFGSFGVALREVVVAGAFLDCYFHLSFVIGCYYCFYLRY